MVIASSNLHLPNFLQLRQLYSIAGTVDFRQFTLIFHGLFHAYFRQFARRNFFLTAVAASRYPFTGSQHATRNNQVFSSVIHCCTPP
jgi:hypothetical protein